MAKKFEVVGNYLIVTDTVTGIEELPYPKSYTRYSKTDDNIWLSRLDTENQEDRYLISEIVDSEGDPFADTDAIVTFLRENTGNFSAPNSANDYTGWASYQDTTYTVGSQLSIVGGASAIALPNNGLSKIESQLPLDVTTFYDGSVITGRNGDGVNITISLAAKPTTGSVTRVTMFLDIGGAIGVIKAYEFEYIFSKGNGIEQRFMRSFDAYTLDTWEANGATVYLESDANIDVYDIRYLITRTHKAR